MKAKFKLASHKQYKANSKSLKPATSTNPAFSIAEYKSEKYEEPSLTPTSTTGDYDADLDQPLYNMAWDSLDEMMIWCQVWENSRGNSGNSRHQVQTYEMSEGTLASAYVLHPFQTLVPRFQNKDDGVLE